MALLSFAPPANAVDLETLAEGTLNGLANSDPQMASSGLVTSQVSFPVSAVGDVAAATAAVDEFGASAVSAEGCCFDETTFLARARFTDVITNITSSPESFTFDFTIAPIRLAIEDGAGISDASLTPMVARYDIEILVNGLARFQSSAELRGGHRGHTLTPMGTDLGGTVVTLLGPLYESDAFADSLPLGTLNPGESVTVTYSISVSTFNPGSETGSFARIGDPLNLALGPGLSGQIVARAAGPRFKVRTQVTASNSLDGGQDREDKDESFPVISSLSQNVAAPGLFLNGFPGAALATATARARGGSLSALARSAGTSGEGSEGRGDAQALASFRLDDLIFTGPAPTVPVSANLIFDGELIATTYTFSQASGSVASVRVLGSLECLASFLNFNGTAQRVKPSRDAPASLSTSGFLDGVESFQNVVLRSDTCEIPTGVPLRYDLELFVHGHAEARGKLPDVTGAGTIAVGRSNFIGTLRFPNSGPVFNLPPGFTANSDQGQVIDNQWAGAQNLPPVCDAGGPYQASCGTPVVEVPLGGSALDPEGDELLHFWTTSCPGATVDDATILTPRLVVDTSEGCPPNPPCELALIVSDGIEGTSCATSVDIAPSQGTEAGPKGRGSALGVEVLAILLLYTFCCIWRLPRAHAPDIGGCWRSVAANASRSARQDRSSRMHAVVSEAQYARRIRATTHGGTHPPADH